MASYSTLPKHLQSAYTRDPRQRQIDVMQGMAFNKGGVSHPLQAIAQLLMAHQVGKKRRGLEEDYEQRGKSYSMALGEALQKIQPSTETERAFGPPTAAGVEPSITRDIPGDYRGASALMSEQDDPDLAMQFALAGARQGQSALQRKQSLEDAARERQNKLADAMKLKAAPGTPGGGPSGRPASAIQQDIYRAKLVEKFGPDSPRVKQFDEIRRAQQWIDIGGKLIAPSRTDPTQPAVEIPKTLAPKDEPVHKAAAAGATAAGAKIGTKNADQFFAVKHAFDQREDIAKLVDHLKSSTAITGFGAEMFKDIERLKAKLGSKVADGTATDTEILDVMMGKEVFPMIKSLGVGARGMDTPAEREFMRSVLTGSITLNKATLIKMAEIRAGVAERTITNWNKRMDAGELDRFYENQGLPKTRFELNAAETPVGLPEGVTEEDITETMRANNMTREQVLQRLGGQ